MPRSVYQPPFHRRILPWVFVIAFLLIAPALIFYTSGYRINPKKISIERNGTLIADSQPNNATILLNGRATNRMTPTTLQGLAPGPYSLRFELTGYLPWEKTLDIRAEQVTFADTVRLWKTGVPVQVATLHALVLEANPERNLIAAIVEDTGRVQAAIFDESGALQSTFALAGLSATYTPRIVWNESGTAFLLDYARGQGDDGWVNVGSGTSGNLPQAEYAWEGTLIVGYDGMTRYAADPRRETLVRSTLANGLAAESDTFDLLTSTSTGDMTLRPRSLLRRLYGLPRGQWHVAETHDAYTLLQSGNRWLAVKRNGEPENETADGDRLRWNDAGRLPRALMLNGNEVWLWTPGESPVLLMRQSEPFVEAAWHRDGFHIFLASRSNVFVLELDDRNGRRMDELVTGFTHINAMSIVGDSLVIGGFKDKVPGIYLRNLQ